MSSENKHLSEQNEILPEACTSQTKLWFCAAPFFEPVVYFLPISEAALGTNVVPSPEVAEVENVPADTFLHKLKIFDSDGELINEVEVAFESNRLGWVEIEPLLASCKFESGIKHGCIEICSQGSYEHKLGLLGEGQPLLINSVKALVKNSGDFFPIYFKQARKAYLGVTNLSDREVTVRTKLMDQQRAPEHDLKIPARAARVISIFDIFAEVLQLDTREDPLAYLRCTLKSEGEVAYSLIDVAEGKNKLNFSF